jgi:hypothetical protein
MVTCQTWPRWLRLVASLGIAVYLLAVVLPPLAGPPPASLLANRIIQPFRPLIGGLALGHGYRFFAPDPGPGHSLRWTVQLPDGTSRTGSIPDAAKDWPRLLYHRRFMLPEKLSGLVPLPGAPAEVAAESKREWLPLVKDIATHLLDREGGSRVQLVLVEHYLPAPDEVVEGRAGEDVIMPLGTYARPGKDAR